MLQQLLGLIAEGRLRTPQALAEALEISPDLMLHMIRQLVDMGYLSGSESRVSSCQACSMAHRCHVQRYPEDVSCTDYEPSAGRAATTHTPAAGDTPSNDVHFWSLTEKGRELIGRHKVT